MVEMVGAGPQGPALACPSAAALPATPSDAVHLPDGDHAVDGVAPNSQSPAVLAGPSGGAPTGRVAAPNAKRTARTRRLDRVRAIIAAGGSATDIAAAFKISANGARRYCRQHGLGLKDARLKSEPRRVITQDQILKAIALQAAGRIWREIGEAVGFTGDAIKVAVSRHRSAQADAAPEPETEEEEDGDVPDEPRILPDANVVASLMMRGFSRRDAIAQSIADKKAKARRETSPAKQSPAPRIGAGPYRMTVGA